MKKPKFMILGQPSESPRAIPTRIVPKRKPSTRYEAMKKAYEEQGFRALRPEYFDVAGYGTLNLSDVVAFREAGHPEVASHIGRLIGGIPQPQIDITLGIPPQLPLGAIPSSLPTRGALSKRLYWSQRTMFSGLPLKKRTGVKHWLLGQR